MRLREDLAELLEKPAAWADADGCQPCGRKQLERSYDLGERNLAELREHAALFEKRATVRLGAVRSAASRLRKSS